METRIRFAQKDDYAAVAGIMKQAQEDHADKLPSIFAHTENVLPQAWYSSYLGRPSRCILLAEASGARVVGLAMMEWHDTPEFPALTRRRYAHISEFAVDRAWRRQGIGTALFQACREWAESHKANQLELKVWEFNERAKAFYEAAGLKTLNRTMAVPLGQSNDGEG